MAEPGLKHVWKLCWGLGVSGTGNNVWRSDQRLYSEVCLDVNKLDQKGRWQCAGTGCQ